MSVSPSPAFRSEEMHPAQQVKEMMLAFNRPQPSVFHLLFYDVTDFPELL